ncbi:MAG: bactofilin family protein [Spirochaetota bacterium]
MAAKNDLQLNSMIGNGSIFEGKFYIDGSLEINGRFEGEIKTKDQLIVGETGKVRTDIFAKKVIVGGTVIGNIEAEEDVSLLSTGRVLGNIKAPRVTIEEGVVIKGEISINSGQKKDIQSIIEESFHTGPKLDNLLQDNTHTKEQQPSGEQTENARAQKQS